ncbi:ankyrin repeat domain-containing protein [Paenibacillus sp. SC116]|uniref:ankyrin repeat domain-containing protein n=1 Tax=Paenibacillus sp. SC116 TaxID=2968986 RepID=UPI0028116805|nr:ankyrin repeat domain-containing protein [Paenibacillus sp. SC116]
MKKLSTKLASLLLISALGTTTLPLSVLHAEPAIKQALTQDMEQAVQELAKLRVMTGYQDGSMKIHNVLTRAELAKMVVLAFGLQGKANQGATFTDVYSKAWHYKYAAEVAARDIMQTKDGRFEANGTLTDAELVQIVAKALNRDVKSVEKWAQPFYSERSNATRGEAAYLLNIARQASKAEVGQPVEEQVNQENQKGVKDMEKLNGDLLAAVKQGNQVLVVKILKDGANIDTTDERGRTSAMIAVHTNQLDLFKLLVKQGANIDIRENNKDNPLLFAGAEGKLDFVKAAIAAGADTTITNRFGGTALIPAADRGHVEVVRELLTNSDVKVNHVNNLGWTALLEAVILGDGGKHHQAIVNLLIEHGADVNLADNDGVTPLQHAKSRGYQEMIDALERAGGK